MQILPASDGWARRAVGYWTRFVYDKKGTLIKTGKKNCRSSRQRIMPKENLVGLVLLEQTVSEMLSASAA